MKRIATGIFVGIFGGFLSIAPLSHRAAAATDRREIGIDELLQLSEKNDPGLEGSKKLETAEQKSVTIARTGYLPDIHFDAIDSGGFPGSTSQLGIGGLAGSPYRSGLAANFVVNQTLWDFGRTGWAVDAAKHSAASQNFQTEVHRIDTDRDAAQEYFACIRYRDQLDAWQFMVNEARIVAREVKKFVATGQRSVVESYLVDAQVDEATTSIADYQERVNLALQRIEIFIRLDWKTIQCPTSSKLGEFSGTGMKDLPQINPRVMAAIEQSESARAQAEKARAEFNPKLVGIAAAGMMERSRLVGKDDYAIGVGLTIPIFDSGRTSAEISRAGALAAAKDFQAESERDRVDYINAKYDEVIQGTKVRLEYLSHEVTLNDKAFALAKNRYFALQGSLVDVREALRNLIRSKSGMAEARSEYMEATYAKAIFNGWRP